MIIDNCSTWAVQVTFPPGSIDAKGSARRWAHNDTITVVAPGVDRALALVRANWPLATVWCVNHSGSRTVLMVDDELLAASRAIDKARSEAAQEMVTALLKENGSR